MLALRFAYLLALVVWLGGMILLATWPAPAEALLRFPYAAYGCGAVMLGALVLMRLLGPRPVRFALRAGIVAAMLGVALWSGLATGRRSAALPRGIDALMLASIAGGLVLVYYEARQY